MFERFFYATTILLTSLGLSAVPVASARSKASQPAIGPEVHHALVTLPFYSVFDNLDFRIEGDTVTLSGQVTRPTLKVEAEKAVLQVGGVRRAINQVEVLPLSASDEKLRLAEYLAIYGDPLLSPDPGQVTPPIHIVVKNGAVTLEGEVNGEMEKSEAFTQASGVPGVSSLTDHLRVSKP